MVAIQLADIPPGFDGMSMPCAPIHWRICGTVKRMIVHMIHFPVLPLTWKCIPPSLRRLSPAATRVRVAAGMARAYSNARRSRRNWGTCMLVVLNLLSVDSLGLCDEAFRHASQTG